MCHNFMTKLWLGGHTFYFFFRCRLVHRSHALQMMIMFDAIKGGKKVGVTVGASQTGKSDLISWFGYSPRKLWQMPVKGCHLENISSKAGSCNKQWTNISVIRILVNLAIVYYNLFNLFFPLYLFFLAIINIFLYNQWITWLLLFYFVEIGI